jgi:TRAP-type C4-dicarboxylate transport system permease small subunit
MRYVLKTPLLGIEEFLFFPAIWLYMLGGANASYERTHIECGILAVYIKRARTKILFSLIKYIISTGIGCWLLYWVYWYLGYCLRVPKTSPLLNIPWIIAQSAIPICLSLMVLYTVVGVVDYFREFMHGDSETADEVNV